MGLSLMRHWQPGQTLMVRPITTVGHSRVPGFIEGRCGTVLRYWGDFPNPEARARGDLDAPLVPVYLLAFDPKTIWLDEIIDLRDRILVDVYGPNLVEIS
jgi:hypothetical protein